MMRRKRLGRTAGLLGLVLVLGACEPGLGAAPEPRADLRVLFVGNSLTYTNDVPAMVQTIAEARGHSFEFVTVARPNYSLEDHWNSGIARSIESAAADVVVLQQGPSSLPASQEHLREWGQRLGAAVRTAGGVPAFYMVWPDRSRLHALDDVRRAYEDAAVATDGIFIPAGVAWERAWDADNDLALYGPDDFHPSRLGSAVAALTIYRVLYDEPLDGLPARIVPVDPALPVVDLGVMAATIYAAVENAVSGTRRGD